MEEIIFKFGPSQFSPVQNTNDKENLRFKETWSILKFWEEPVVTIFFFYHNSLNHSLDHKNFYIFLLQVVTVYLFMWYFTSNAMVFCPLILFFPHCYISYYLIKKISRQCNSIISVLDKFFYMRYLFLNLMSSIGKSLMAAVLACGVCDAVMQVRTPSITFTSCRNWLHLKCAGLNGIEA